MDYRNVGFKQCKRIETSAAALLLYAAFDFDADKHPRYPAGTYKNNQNVGGQFRGKESATTESADDIPENVLSSLTPETDLGFVDISQAKSNILSGIDRVQESFDGLLPNTDNLKEEVRSGLSKFSEKGALHNFQEGAESFLTEFVPSTVRAIASEIALDPIGTGLLAAGVGAVTVPSVVGEAGMASIQGGLSLLASKWKIPAAFRNINMSNLSLNLVGLGSAFLAISKFLNLTKAYSIDRYHQEKIDEIEDKYEKEKENVLAEGPDRLVNELSDRFEDKTGISKEALHERLREKEGLLPNDQNEIFKERIRELDELVKKGREKTPGGRWRRGVIEAELNHGEDIDKLVMTPTTNTDIIDDLQYNKFLDSLKKSKDQPIKAKPLQKDFAAWEGYGEEFVRFWNEERLNQDTDAARKTKRRIDKAIEEAEKIDKITKVPGIDVQFTAPEVDFPFTQPEIRGFNETMKSWNPFSGEGGEGTVVSLGANKNIGGNPALLPNAINFQLAGKDEKTTVWHELGHTIEQKTGSTEESVALVKDRQRTRNESLSYQDRTKQTRKNSFYTGEYTEKLYATTPEDKASGKANDTEVVSMGLEQLAHASTAKMLAARDREHLLYTLHVLNQSGN